MNIDAVKNKATSPPILTDSDDSAAKKLNNFISKDIQSIRGWNKQVWVWW